jgi:hypothetical protein
MLKREKGRCPNPATSALAINARLDAPNGPPLKMSSASPAMKAQSTAGRAP